MVWYNATRKPLREDAVQNDTHNGPAPFLFGEPLQYWLSSDGENEVQLAVYGPFTFVPSSQEERPWKPEPKDAYLEFLDSWQKARDGVVELTSPSLFDLVLGDTLPGYGYVYQGRVYAYGDEELEFSTPDVTEQYAPPPKSLGPRAAQTKTKPGVRAC